MGLSQLRIGFFILNLLACAAWSAEPPPTEVRTNLIELHGSEKTPPEDHVFVKDPVSQKVASIELQKSSSDPLINNGYFSIRFFQDQQDTSDLEIQDSNRNSLFAFKSSQGAITKYIVFYTAPELEKYTTDLAKAEKEAMLKSLQSTQGATMDQKEKIKIAEQQTRTQVQMQEQVQVSLEQAEVQARMAQLQQDLSAETKAANKAKAEQLAANAHKWYVAQKYKNAATLFKKAAELDPENEDAYYNYGVSLYKIREYNKSLAVLSAADAPEGQQLEKDYYLALNHLKLKNYETALKELHEIREEQHPELSPLASYFAGTIEMQQQKFPAARKSMEYILDNSKDKKLDRSAEQTLEQIDKLEAFYNSKKEKYRLTAFSGVIYDGNVVNEATNSSATNNAAYRLNYGVNGNIYLRRKLDSDLGLYAGLSDYYSESTSLAATPAIQIADAQEFDFKVPYHSTWVSGVKAQNSYVWDFTPLFRTITMSPAVGSPRSVVIQSLGFSSTFASPYRKNLYLAARLDYTSDRYFLPTTSSADDETGNSYGLTLIPTWLVGLKGTQSFSTEIGYTANQSNGANYQYGKTAAAVSYGFPLGHYLNTARLDYAYSNYAAAAIPRQDNITTATLSTLKPLIKEKLNLSLSVQYANANSSLAIYQYSKFVFTSLLTWTTNFLD